MGPLSQPWKIDKVVRTGTLYQKLQGCRINFAIDPIGIYQELIMILQEYLNSILFQN